MDEPLKNKGIVLFDGFCNLCNRSVNYIIDHDKNDHFRFTTLQGQTGVKLTKSLDIPEDLRSLVLIEGEEVSFRSTAVLRIARKLGFPYNLFYTFNVLPSFLRDPIYSLISANRYRIFGKRNTCRTPTPKIERKFLK